MNKLIKIFSLIVFSAIILIGCGKDLVGEYTVDNDALPGKNFILNNETANYATLGIYNRMQNRYVYGGELHFFEGLYADDFVHTGTFTEFVQAGASNFLDSNLSVQRIWNNHYTVIKAANVVIDQLETNPNAGNTVSSDVKNQSLGEAYAARALMHFNLVRLFGRVPYVTTPVYSSDQIISPAREEVNAVYQKIIDDFNKSVSFFSSNNPVEKSRLNLNSVRYFLANVYMEQNNFLQAKNLLEQITGYSLAPNYASLFTGSSTVEDIFKLDYTADDGGNQAFFFYPAALGGRGEVSVRPNFISSFASNDTRRLFSASGSRNYFTKYSNPGSGADKVHLVRYAAVLLSLSEARLKTSGDALTPLNAVRSRAGQPTLSAVSLNDIVVERRKELYGEVDRWFTVKRLGLAKSVIEGKGAVYFDKRLDLWPIPAFELDNNTSMQNPRDQNPGY